VSLLSYSYQVPLAVPYWNGATYRGILRSVLSGSVIDGPDLGALRSAVMERLGAEDAIICGSGSLALEIALGACGVHEGDEVVIPTFCCTSIVPPILAVGANPVLADVGEELNITAGTAEAVLTNKTTAIIVPHLFGNPADINAIVDLARPKNIRVIDDAAQALGATIDGRPVGSFGDAGILSFGSEKVCFGLGGGVVVSRQKENLNGGSKMELPPARLSPTLRTFLSTLAWRRWRRWTLPAQAWLSHANTGNPDSPPNPYRKEILPNLNAAVALSLLQTLDENIAARRARVRAYQEVLGADERLTLVPHEPGSACLGQLVRVLPGRRDEDLSAHLVEALHCAGYEVQGSYVPIHLLPDYEEWLGQCLPHAERVWSDLIELPCGPEVSFAHVERIAYVVKQALRSGVLAPSYPHISHKASGGSAQAEAGLGAGLKPAPTVLASIRLLARTTKKYVANLATLTMSLLCSCSDRVFRCISDLSQNPFNRY
jgi:dTDP-4-amino-4,6-dideoxygalactose transaminase